jgi:hypothetical protein
MRIYLEDILAAPVQKTAINGCGDPLRLPRNTLLPTNIGTIFADKRQPAGQYSLVVDQKPRSLY